MTFVPTKKRQKDWVREHLNGGVCPKEREEWVRVHRAWLCAHIGYRRYPLACFEALEWLSETNVTTLAEAWKQCKEPSWLFWALSWMEPSLADHAKLVKFWKWLVRASDVPVHSVWAKRSPSTGHTITEIFTGVSQDLSVYSHGYMSENMTRRAVRYIKRLWPNPWKE